MKKHLLISTTLFLTLTVGYGQANIYHPFPDSSAQWNMYFLSSVLCQVSGKDYYSMVISGDTLIGSQTYHKLNIYGVQIISTSLTNASQCWNTVPAYKGAIRQEIINKKVYIVPPSASSEQLLYDFNMQVGDTLKGYLANTNSSAMPDIVQSIDSVLVGSNYRKRWKINSIYQIDFIEGIGSTYGLVESSPANMTDQRMNWLVCFKQNNTTLYFNPSFTTNCNLITSVNSIQKNLDQIKYFPNPFSSTTTLQTDKIFKNASLTVYNAFGQTVKQVDNLTGQAIVFHRDNLPSGLYFVRLTEEKKIIAVDKFVITDK